MMVQRVENARVFQTMAVVSLIIIFVMLHIDVACHFNCGGSRKQMHPCKHMHQCADIEPKFGKMSTGNRTQFARSKVLASNHYTRKSYVLRSGFKWYKPGDYDSGKAVNSELSGSVKEMFMKMPYTENIN